jgi:uncharacterized glyoxalase superfamily protein PhnB
LNGSARQDLWQLGPAINRHLRDTQTRAEVAARLCARLVAMEAELAHAEVRAGDRAIWLHPAGEEDKSPRSLGGVSSMTVIAVEDADAHHARTVEAGGQIIKEPVDQPYGQREYGARDLEGQLWYFQSPLG